MIEYKTFCAINEFQNQENNSFFLQQKALKRSIDILLFQVLYIPTFWQIRTKNGF